ncbi:MAG: DMT family transporter [Alphaproteobacteria bacterium]
MPDILRAILLMVLGSFLFMLADMFMKLSSQTMSIGLVSMMLGGGMALFFAVLMLRSGSRFFDPRYLHFAMAMRCVGEAVGVMGIVIALAFSPLATVTALMQSLPLVLTIMGAVFLKEPVGWRRILALMAGLIGVLIIIRPGMAGFDLFATFTLLGVAGMAIRDFGTRIMPREISTAALSFYGSLTIVLMGMAMIIFSGDWRAPTAEGMRYIVGLVVVGSLGTLAVSTAMRLGDVSVISPFRYVRVVFGVGAGILVFGETVDLPVILGSTIVIGAGLYSWMRERKLTLNATDR